jgi:hypothetical protein
MAFGGLIRIAAAGGLALAAGFALNFSALRPAAAQASSQASSSPSQYANSFGNALKQNGQLSQAMIKQYLERRVDTFQGYAAPAPGSFAMGFAPMGFAPGAALAPDAASGDLLAPMPLGFASDPTNAMVTKAPVYKAPPAPVGPSLAMWGQGFGGWQRTSLSAAGVDLSSALSTYGFQGGVDETWRGLATAGDALVLGAVGSFTTAVDSFAAGVSAGFNGPGAGLYGTYISGGFSADMTAKVDFLSLDEAVPGAPTASTSLDNYTVAANTQYKFDLGGKAFLEPTAGLIYTATQFDGGAAALGLANGYVWRFQGGARVGREFVWNGTTIETSLRGLLYDNAIDKGTVIAAGLVGAPGASLEGLMFGEVDAEVNADFGNGYSAFGSLQTFFADHIVGGVAMFGGRKQW